MNGQLFNFIAQKATTNQQQIHITTKEEIISKQNKVICGVPVT